MCPSTRHSNPMAGAKGATHLKIGHVDSIDVRSLLSINFNRHEVIVEYFGDGLVFERFMFHDMAPVTRTVTNYDEMKVRQTSNAVVYSRERWVCVLDALCRTPPRSRHT